MHHSAVLLPLAIATLIGLRRLQLQSGLRGRSSACVHLTGGGWDFCFPVRLTRQPRGGGTAVLQRILLRCL